MAGSGKSAETYYAAARNLPDAFLRGTFTDNGLTEDEVRTIQADARDTRIDELLGQNSGAVDGRIDRGAALANRRRGERNDKAKNKARNDDSTLMSILMDIDRLEKSLAVQYGENFAGNLFSDLHVSGLIENDEYQRIMAIDDDTEHRRAIALRIQEGLDNGTIKPEDLNGHPWAKDWLKEHGKATAEMTRQAARYERGEVSADDLNENAKHEAGELSAARGPDQESAVEVLARAENSSNQLDQDGQNIASRFDASKFSF